MTEPAETDLAGEWGAVPAEIAIAIPVAPEMFRPMPATQAQQAADLVAGTAARVAREAYMNQINTVRG